MGIYYSTNIAVGAIFNKKNAHILKELVRKDELDNYFKGNKVVSSFQDLALEGIPGGFLNGAFVTDYANDGWSGDIEESIIIHFANHKVSLHQETFDPFRVDKLLKLTQDEKNLALLFNRNYVVPFGHKPVKFKPVVWTSIN